MPGLSGPDSPLKAGGRLAGGGQFRTHTATSAKLEVHPGSWRHQL